MYEFIWFIRISINLENKISVYRVSQKIGPFNSVVDSAGLYTKQLKTQNMWIVDAPGKCLACTGVHANSWNSENSEE